MGSTRKYLLVNFTHTTSILLWWDSDLKSSLLKIRTRYIRSYIHLELKAVKLNNNMLTLGLLISLIDYIL